MFWDQIHHCNNILLFDFKKNQKIRDIFHKQKIYFLFETKMRSCCILLQI
jgi:hypothetical protein